MKQIPHRTPVKIGFRTRLNLSISKIMHNIPSNMPICEPSPNASNIVKNRIAHKVCPGSSTIACVKTKWHFLLILRLKLKLI